MKKVFGSQGGVNTEDQDTVHGETSGEGERDKSANVQTEKQQHVTDLKKQSTRIRCYTYTTQKGTGQQGGRRLTYLGAMLAVGRVEIKHLAESVFCASHLLVCGPTGPCREPAGRRLDLRREPRCRLLLRCFAVSDLAEQLLHGLQHGLLVVVCGQCIVFAHWAAAWISLVFWYIQVR